MESVESASESGQFDEKKCANMDEEGSDNDDNDCIDSDERLDGRLDRNFSTETCALPRILDGTYYKMSSPVSHTYTVKATCLTCSREVAGSIRSTGNFFSHMDKKHPSRAGSCRAYCQTKSRKSSDMKILKIRRPLAKPIGGAMITQVKIDPSMRRPKILDGKYFELVKKWSNGKIAATCSFCHRNVCAHISHTGNLFTHIRVKHLQSMEECRTYCNTVTSESRMRPTTWEVNHEQPIEEVYIEDESTTETTRAISDDVFAEEFDSYFTQQGAAEEDGKHSGARYSSTSAKRNGSDDQKLPKCERKQFSQLVYASLNQLTDRNALQAMMEIQGVLTKYRLASLPN